MISDYYSIDDILLSQELVPVTFDHDAARMNYLAQSQDLSKGTKVQVPLWLAQGFLFENQAKIGLPEYLEEKKQDSMIADPENFNLQQTPKYYEVGKIGTRLQMQFLEHTWRIRRGKILRNAHSKDRTNAQVDDALLSESENEIFQCGRRGTLEWEKATRQFRDILRKSPYSSDTSQANYLNQF